VRRVAAAGTVGKTLSASHTINGHSVVLRLTYGNVRCFFGGDLNAEAMSLLRSKVPSGGLEAEIVKGRTTARATSTRWRCAPSRRSSG
jgi:beta-lactamase superfamily II metal-dependent hydrolase